MKRFFLAVFILLTCSTLFGQTVNQLAGKVVDLKNKGIEGVEVRLESTGTSKYTDQDGNFEFNGEFKMAEPIYSFELYKEGYIPVGNTHQKKAIFVKGNIENILMKEDTERYLWVTVVDAESLEFLKDVEIDILGKQEKTNKSGKAKFDLTGLGKNTVNASFLKKCYKNELTQINTKGEQIVKLIYNCGDDDPPPLQEDLTSDIVGKYKIKSNFLNFNPGFDMDREYEIEVKKKNNNTITILDNIRIFIIVVDISYDVQLTKSGNKILFDIPKQVDVNQTIKGTGYSNHDAHGEFIKKTGKINFSYVASDETANMKYNIVGYKKE